MYLDSSTINNFSSGCGLQRVESHVEHQGSFRQVLLTLQGIDTNSLEQILLYTVEMLQDRAYVVLQELGDIGLALHGTSNLR